MLSFGRVNRDSVVLFPHAHPCAIAQRAGPLEVKPDRVPREENPPP